MATIIQVRPSVPDQEFSSILGGKVYRFRVRWNRKAARWSMSVSEENGTAIVSGVALVLGAYLGRRSVHPLFRDGILTLWDTNKTQIEPGLDDLGARVQLRYFTRDEAAGEVLGRLTQDAGAR